MFAIALLATFTITRAAPPTQSADDFVKTWAQVSSAISSMYYARSTHRAEMDRLLAKYKPICVAAHSRDEFEKGVNEMIAEFKDSHFAFYTPDDQGYYTMDSLVKQQGAAKMPNIGAYFRTSPAGYVVQMVVEGSPARAADLRKGDVILAADGARFRPIRSFIANQTVDLTVSRSGQEIHKKVKAQEDTAMGMFLGGTSASIKVIPDNGRKIGYIHMWTLASDSFRNALSGAVDGKLADTDAFILDLRDGFGGRPENFADPFFRPEATLDWTYANDRVHEQFGYQRPLIVLINNGSRSAKEVLSFILQKSRRATLVGSRTAGNVLGATPYRVNAWSYIEIPLTDLSVDGVRLEGKGVDPDVNVPAEFDATGRDLYLAKALDMLKSVRARV
jgi:carboxyl-terminal processing protease